ncbi:hypothetical protein IFM12275_07980 [Nocardia sputorum]|uniref:IPT/TIG domain-containing protein n=1 Tax=Nocardia sputorum TaxID=2984338 RepID=UPI002490918D|nr:IPT/TIG domain-containing protein [Nocardia sputorum]BDT90822.1 hypothetical protein IFM12275_07980 [Nocardia sputorum]
MPTITSLVPTSGPTTGGTGVTITGTGFADTTSVQFGTTSAAFTIDSPAQITATAPAGTGTVQVTVTAAGGTSNGVSYTYSPSAGTTTITVTGTLQFTITKTGNCIPCSCAAAPTLTAVTPSSGSAAGGTTVTLTGTNLSAASAVSFGATAATSFTVDSDTQITAVAPAGTGTVQVTVTAVGGTSNGVSYAYVPALASIFQFQGPEAGGHLVYLNGSGLTGVTAVTFGSTPATSFTVNSDTEIAVFTPAGTGTVQVTATGPSGTSNGVPYTYVPVPSLTSANPTSGPEAGGNTVVLTGTGLATGASVRFGIVASDFIVDSDTQITAVAVPGTGTVDITVITAGGTSNGVSYTYV